MNRGIPAVALLVSAILAFPAPARAQHEERREGAPRVYRRPAKPHAGNGVGGPAKAATPARSSSARRGKAKPAVVRSKHKGSAKAVKRKRKVMAAKKGAKKGAKKAKKGAKKGKKK